jgi:hypothetical protein
MIDSQLIGRAADLTVALTKMRRRQEVLFDDMQLWKKRSDEAEDHLRDLQVNRRSSVGCVSAQQNASPTISKMMRCPPGQHILGWIGMIIYREIP